jgi:hypothetical protein
VSASSGSDATNRHITSGSNSRGASVMIGAWLLVPLTWLDSVPKFLASNKLCGRTTENPRPPRVVLGLPVGVAVSVAVKLIVCWSSPELERYRSNDPLRSGMTV